MTENPREQLAEKIASQSDDMLCTIAVQLYQQTETRTADVALVARMVSDELCKRYPAADGLMGQWFDDESPAGVEFITSHTYGELVALAATMARENLAGAVAR